MGKKVSTLVYAQAKIKLYILIFDMLYTQKHRKEKSIYQNCAQNIEA